MSWAKRRTAVGVALACGLLSVTGPAVADDLEDGVRQYEALDYEKAQKTLEAAVKDDTRSTDDIGRAAMYLGLVHYNLGNTVAAETYFGVALTFDDSLQLPPGTSPKIGKTFDEIRKLVFPVPRSGDGGGGVTPVKVNDGGSDTGPPKWGQNESPPRSGDGDKRLPLWTIGSGAATVITGSIALYFALKSHATKNSIEDTPHSREELAALQDDLNTETTTANVLFAATGAFALSTAAFYLFEVRSGGSKERKVSVGATATGSSAWVGARWTF